MVNARGQRKNHDEHIITIHNPWHDQSWVRARLIITIKIHFLSPPLKSTFLSNHYNRLIPTKTMKNDPDFFVHWSTAMDGDKLKTRMKKMKRRYATATPAFLRITGSVATMVLLLWTISCGFLMTMEPWRYIAVAAPAFHVGVTTMVFGFLFLIVGLSILADLFLNISEQLPELSVQHQGQETRTISKAIAKALVTGITMFVILWTMYIGFRLATESGESKHYLLTISIGVITILFGLIYFIIGLAIVLELVLEFWTRTQ